MKEELIIPENRGVPLKYDVSNMLVGDRLSFEDTTTGNLLTCAKSYCKRHGLDWSFRCYSENGLTVIIRIK